MAVASLVNIACIMCQSTKTKSAGGRRGRNGIKGEKSHLSCFFKGQRTEMMCSKVKQEKFTKPVARHVEVIRLSNRGDGL